MYVSQEQACYTGSVADPSATMTHDDVNVRVTFPGRFPSINITWGDISHITITILPEHLLLIDIPWTVMDRALDPKKHVAYLSSGNSPGDTNTVTNYVLGINALLNNDAVFDLEHQRFDLHWYW